MPDSTETRLPLNRVAWFPERTSGLFPESSVGLFSERSFGRLLPESSSVILPESNLVLFSESTRGSFPENNSKATPTPYSTSFPQRVASVSTRSRSCASGAGRGKPGAAIREGGALRLGVFADGGAILVPRAGSVGAPVLRAGPGPCCAGSWDPLAKTTVANRTGTKTAEPTSLHCMADSPALEVRLSGIPAGNRGFREMSAGVGAPARKDTNLDGTRIDGFSQAEKS